MVDWTLTLGLSKALYRPISDVQGGVVIGVIAMAAIQAIEPRAVAVPLVAGRNARLCMVVPAYAMKAEHRRQCPLTGFSHGVFAHNHT